ncbi:GTP:AMP phosphotransferase AK3, mitochondrial-like [Limulus polyphemus]|uniref:GTP:AMP phosphotransferase, mitochondrial n=1 Tax=Limulus polyphemus TaxID=6850 RepID=A0ABM1BQK0_LIMPO|nr:GTP:AMP phosphotransferase AK3, mitochondrial-like [Limulus polyphemus]
MISRVFRGVIMGPPGSGKGTISSRIAQSFVVTHLSSGDLLRAQIQEGTIAGVQASQYIEKGELVPDDLVVQLILAELHTSLKNKNWLLDGFPSTVSQAKTLQKNFSLSCVLSLNVPDDVIIERVKNRWVHAGSGRTYHIQFKPPKVPGLDDVTGEPLIQRQDDKPETVETRLRNYKKQSTSVLEFYRERGLLQEFTGRESNEIWPRVQAYLSSLIDKKQDKSVKRLKIT